MKNIINLGLTNTSKICFRYKNRLSLKIIDTDSEKLSIDVTSVQNTFNINELNTSLKNYELEIELVIL
jgi:hypothetical protein